jgi:hypothetical protein
MQCKIGRGNEILHEFLQMLLPILNNATLILITFSVGTKHVNHQLASAVRCKKQLFTQWLAILCK